MKAPTYFMGDPANMGRVTAIPEENFAELVDNVIRHPVPVGITQGEMFALPEKEQNEKKKTKYLVPSVFKTSPSPRQTGSATHCNLLFADIDDPKEASRMLNAGFLTLLGDLNAVVYHTARSTSENPRLRIVVPTLAPVPVAQYGTVVTALAGMLGMSSLNKESQVAVQPMYLPVQYKGSTTDPVIYAKTDGKNFDAGVVADLATLPLSNAGLPDDMGDIEYLRAPLDDIGRDEVIEALGKIDADCSMQQWIEIGMALKHQFGDAGFTIWDDWSATAKSKYPGQSDPKEGTAAKWETFVQNPKDRVPVTIRSVIKIAVEAGWNNRQLTARLFDSCRDWIRNPSRSSEELLDQGPKRIAKLGTVIGPLEQKVLISDLHSTTKSRGLRGPTVLDISKDIKRLTNAALRASSTQPPWASNIAFLTAPNLFYRYLDNRKMRGEVIDLIYQSPNPERPTREYLVRDVGIPVVENVRYNPAIKAKVFTVGGIPYINTYRVSYPEPDASMKAEAGDLYMEHAINLCGKLWKIPTNFIAYCVQHPGKKIRFAVFIQSGMGAGKGLLGYIIELVLGQSNVQRLAAEHILEGSHNGWAAGFQVTIVDEIRVMGPNRYRIMDKVKPVISDDQISVRNLYEPVQTVPNITNYLFFSNYQDALAVHHDDRRYCAIESPLQVKRQIVGLGLEYYNRMYGGCARLAPGLRAFFEDWKICPDFNPEGRAPATPFLNAMARNSASPLCRAVLDVLEDEPHPLVRRDLVSLTALRAVLPTSGLPAFSDQGLASVLREEGYQFAGRHLLDGSRHSLWVMDHAGSDPVQSAYERLTVL